MSCPPGTGGPDRPARWEAPCTPLPRTSSTRPRGHGSSCRGRGCCADSTRRPNPWSSSRRPRAPGRACCWPTGPAPFRLGTAGWRGSNWTRTTTPRHGCGPGSSRRCGRCGPGCPLPAGRGLDAGGLGRGPAAPPPGRAGRGLAAHPGAGRGGPAHRPGGPALPGGLPDRAARRRTGPAGHPSPPGGAGPGAACPGPRRRPRGGRAALHPRGGHRPAGEPARRPAGRADAARAVPPDRGMGGGPVRPGTRAHHVRGRRPQRRRGPRRRRLPRYRGPGPADHRAARLPAADQCPGRTQPRVLPCRHGQRPRRSAAAGTRTDRPAAPALRRRLWDLPAPPGAALRARRASGRRTAGRGRGTAPRGRVLVPRAAAHDVRRRALRPGRRLPRRGRGRPRRLGGGAGRRPDRGRRAVARHAAPSRGPLRRPAVRRGGDDRAVRGGPRGGGALARRGEGPAVLAGRRGGRGTVAQAAAVARALVRCLRGKARSRSAKETCTVPLR